MEPYIIFSHGRCGSTLLADLVAATLYSKEKNIRYTKDTRLANKIAKFSAETIVKRFAKHEYVFHDDGAATGVELEKNKVIHTHTLDHRYTELQKTSTIFFCTRRDLVETLSSLMIARHSGVYNHFLGSKDNGPRQWSNIPVEKLVYSDDQVQNFIKGEYGLFERYNNCKQQNTNTHLLFYEDWIQNFENLPFKVDYNQDLNHKMSRKVPVDKKEWVDYHRLTRQVLEFNNGSTQLKIQ